MDKIPFYSNTKDNTHCHQTALRMVLKYFMPEKDYSFKALDKLTGKTKNKWTWPTKGMLSMHSLGFDIQRRSDFDYALFIANPVEYMIKKYGKEKGEAQIKNSNLKREVEYVKEYLKLYTNNPKLPTLDDLKNLLKKGYLLIVNVNYYPLYAKKGYSGHSILVYKITKQHVFFHDPGLPARENAKITLKRFINAWEYPDKTSRNYQAYKLK